MLLFFNRQFHTEYLGGKNLPSLLCSAISALILLSLFVTPGVADPTGPEERDQPLMVAQVRGDLIISETASTFTYTAYFHVPVPTEAQVPLWIEVTSPRLIDYRFIRTTGNNILVAAHLYQGPTNLSWSASVLIENRSFNDAPEYTPMPTSSDLPDSVLPFLQATATAQVDCAPVQDWTNSLNFSNMATAAEDLCAYCNTIPGGFPHSPMSLDAFYALTWGNSCTGHAHAATALLRGLGIPARTKLVLLTWYPGAYDMHWTSDYFVPDYGWIGMDTTMDENPMATTREVVIYQCDPADEFPLFFNSGIDAFWHTSDKALGVMNPGWGGAHQCDGYTYAYGTGTEQEQVLALARQAFDFEIDYRGVNLPPAELLALQASHDHHNAANNLLIADDVTGAIAELQLAVAGYGSLDGGSVVTRYATDFEDGVAGWSCGGYRNEWALGEMGPDTAHSGTNCWGTDLDGSYYNDANTWLLSPPVDLSGLYSAELEFWLWNEVWGGLYYYNAGDYLYLEITTDGTTFIPFCSAMRGGTDDPLIPLVSGWARMDLDLTPYVGETVQIRFHFISDSEDCNRSGSYVDDVKITGRADPASPVFDEVPQAAGRILTQTKIFPNPFNPQTKITFELARPQQVGISVYDMTGKRVALLADRTFSAGPQALDWNGQDQAGKTVSSGTYLLRIKAGAETWQGKMMLVR